MQVIRDRTRILVLLTTVVTAACDRAAPLAPTGDGPAFARASAVSVIPLDEPFDTLDPAVWSAGDHGLGLGWLDPANVSVAAGELRLRTPAGTRDGAEIASVERAADGTFETSMRCALPAGALCAFFLYEGVPGNRNDEIDIEIIADTRRMMMTTWVRGRQTNHTEITLGFDPSANFHTYGIERAAGGVAFTVDGVRQQRWTRKLPGRAMKIYANAWWPTWLTSPLPAADGDLAIDWVRAS
jgi:beta-glucanase (GH16 family)